MAGLGVASTQILPPISALSYIKVTAAADTRADALGKFREKYGGQTFTSVETMCESSDVDAIYIATPNELHAQHAIAAAERGKHVIVEKPMALSIPECDAMNEAAEKHGVKLLCGHTHSFDSPIRKMREIVNSGELGKLCMINTWNYNEFMYRPRMKHELATSRGVVLNQGPHQVDIARLIGGGKVRSVRAMAGIGDPLRPGEGHYTGYLEFEDGAAASLVYSGYAYFDSAELIWGIGEGGELKDPERHLKARQFFRRLRAEASQQNSLEEKLEQWRYGGSSEGQWTGESSSQEKRQPFFGLTVVTCEKGDIRQSPDGLFVYTEEGKKEITIARGSHGREAELKEFYDAIVNNRLLFHDGRWGEATLEVCLGILQSAAEKREIIMAHQVAVPDQQ